MRNFRIDIFEKFPILSNLYFPIAKHESVPNGCMCGNTINHNSPMTDSQCSATCIGNKYTSCGGSCRVSIYGTDLLISILTDNVSQKQISLSFSL